MQEIPKKPGMGRFDDDDDDKINLDMRFHPGRPLGHKEMDREVGPTLVITLSHTSIR